ncbi:MAG: hypothetical protein WBP81_04815 [Solirubrobacteraceae bacterium]
MSELLTEAIETAREQHESVEALVLLRTANEELRRAACLLSITVGLAEEDLADLLARLWPASGDVRDAVATLSTRSIVQRAEGKLHVIEAARSALARQFAREEPEVFVNAHKLLAAMEESRDSEDDPYASWFTRGRVAFYLAGTKPDLAAAEFGKLFAAAPATDRAACRIWISSLVLRQEPLLSDHAREVGFFRAFRQYKMGDWTGAHQGFEVVIESRGDDVYRAMALLQLGILLRTRDPARGIELLDESVALSSRLHVFENELMARTSRLWAYIDRGDLLRSRTDYERAWEEGQQTLEWAALERNLDPMLRAGTVYSATVAEWLWRSDNRRVDVDEEVVQRLVREFDWVYGTAISEYELDLAVSAANQAAEILVATGSYSSALNRIEKVVARIERVDMPPKRISHLVRTTDSILLASKAEGDRVRARLLLDHLEEMRSQRSSNKRISKIAFTVETVTGRLIMSYAATKSN